MKTRLTIFLSLLITWSAFGDILKTPSGIQYYKFGTGSDVVVYFDGYSDNPQPLSSAFYLNFLPSVVSNVTCYIPVPLAKTGWEKPLPNGLMMGTDFLNFVADNHILERIFVTGYSAGGDPGYIYAAKRVTAFASVAGSDLNGYTGMMQWRSKGIPVWSFIGTTDTSENSRANCEKTWITWFYTTSKIGKLKDGAPTYVNGSHPIVDDYAYNPANGLWEWFDSIDKPVPPPPTTPPPDTVAYVVYDNGVWIRVMKSGLVYKEN